MERGIAWIQGKDFKSRAVDGFSCSPLLPARRPGTLHQALLPAANRVYLSCHVTLAWDPIARS